ncbi:MAG: thiamine pyrophosphate-dependent dehydrogenase E1 component subunit alpha [Actinobacteria bacterium]|nr:thiamine pyrophosphate-dependent dehydrogenase E1 component subunit alpha [Actinomycetota bacterium]
MSEKININTNQKIEFFRQMYTIRKFEEKVKELLPLGLIRGATHVYIGEEAIAVGACAALNEDDYIVSTHRGHGHCIAKGGKLKPMMAELLGKESGYCKGKGGSMHIANVDSGMLGASGVVASGIPIATGAAFSSKFLENNKVTVSFFGDGASNNGTFHECLNLASIWKLPIIFICENNRYAITVPLEISTSVKDISTRSAGYNMPGIIVDGRNVEEVYRVTTDAVKRAREGKGPTLIEAKTYRFEGHWIGDPQVYREKDEVESEIACDHLLDYEKKLVKENIVSAPDMENIKKEIENELDEAVSFAKESPFLDASKVADDIFS